MISAKELREGNCNKETVERGLILIDKLVKDNRMKRFVDVKLNKAFYNEYEYDEILNKLMDLGYFIDYLDMDDELTLSREFTLRW